MVTATVQQNAKSWLLMAGGHAMDINGVDVNGSLSNRSAFKTWSDANHDLVFHKTVNPGPFTLTINQPQGGSITVSPQKDQYNRDEEITLTAVPNEGNEL